MYITPVLGVEPYADGIYGEAVPRWLGGQSMPYLGTGFYATELATAIVDTVSGTPIYYTGIYEDPEGRETLEINNGAGGGEQLTLLRKVTTTATITNRVDTGLFEHLDLAPIIDGTNSFMFSNGTNLFFVNVNSVTNPLTSN